MLRSRGGGGSHERRGVLDNWETDVCPRRVETGEKRKGSKGGSGRAIIRADAGGGKRTHREKNPQGPEE